MGILRVTPAELVDGTTDVKITPSDSHNINVEEIRSFAAPWLLAGSPHTSRTGYALDPVTGVPCALVGVAGKTLVAFFNADACEKDELAIELALGDLADRDQAQALHFFKKNARWEIVEKGDVLYMPMASVPF